MQEQGTQVEAGAKQGTRSSPLRKSASDMLRTMALMALAVGLLVLLVPRPSSIPRPVVDLDSAVAQAQADLGFVPAQPVPDGWTVTSARVRRDTGDIPSWTINYLTDEDRYVGLVQAAGWSQRWQTSLTHGGEPEPDVAVAGLTWQVLVKPERELTSLLRREGDDTVLIMAKTGGLDDASALAEELARTRGTSGGTDAADGTESSPDAP